VTDAAIILAFIALCLVATLSFVIGTHARERRAWTIERKQLVDRAIARHAGEVLALDREPKVKPDRDEPAVYVEGLS
jgi:hypothetical protein